MASISPSFSPSLSPSYSPSKSPSLSPSLSPSISPSISPSVSPSPANLIYPPTQNGLQKTLGATLDASYTTSATLSNTTGLQNKKGLFVVDRIDSSGAEKDASLREYISFAGVSGSTVTTLVRGLGGTTDQSHATGAIVEFVMDVVQQQAVIDTLLVGHGTDGTHKATTLASEMKATGAQIDTGTSDVLFATPKAIADSTLSYTTGTETLTNKTLTSPTINGATIATPTITGATITNPTLTFTDNAPGVNVKVRAYLAGAQNDLTNTTPTLVNLETEDYDVGSDFSVATHLFTVPVTGYYQVDAQIHLSSVVASKEYHIMIKNNGGVVLTQKWINSPSVMVNSILGIGLSDIIYITAGDTLGLYAQSDSGNNTVDLYPGQRYVYMAIHLLSV